LLVGYETPAAGCFFLESEHFPGMWADTTQWYVLI